MIRFVTYAFLTMSLAMSCAKAQDVVVPTAGASAVIDKIKADGVMKVGVIQSAPFIMFDPIQDKYTGPAAEFMQKAADTLGVKIQWVEVTWDTMIAGLQAHQYEVLATATYATEARKAVVDFVNYSKSGMCWVALKSNTQFNTRDDMVKNASTMVIASGASFTADLPKKYPQMTVMTKQVPPGANSFYDDVRTKRVDLSYIESLLAPQVAAAQPDIKVIPSIDECLKSPDFPIDIGIAINKGDGALHDFLTAVVKESQPDIDKAIKEPAAQ